MTFADPCLILLDCQRDQVTGPNGKVDPDNQAVIDRIGDLLRHARQSGWRVCHCQFQGEGSAAGRAPIDGLRPTAQEAVFKRRGLSAFSDPFFHQVLARSAGSSALLVGFSAPFSILATVFDDANRDKTLTVVPEAVGALAVEPRDVAETRSMAFDLVSRMAPTMSWDRLTQGWSSEMPAV
ncbi:cysteine hydrolase [uncultured Maricaulis sp.]|uniref:cysteine hydrolase n=1 Tax=uncultured Maricaulis sp. TaxID=174710 RepID=UPI0026177144|nr:cysteine hydrolase [uncultured Maricaulis sp.]